MENLKELWLKIIDSLKAKFTEENVNLWLLPLELYRKGGSEFVLEVPNKFFKNWVQENCAEDIKSAIAGMYGFSADPDNNREDVKLEYIELQNLSSLSSAKSSDDKNTGNIYKEKPGDLKNENRISDNYYSPQPNTTYNHLAEKITTADVKEKEISSYNNNDNGDGKISQQKEENKESTAFNPKLTFSKFITGKQNQFAYSGAWAVANDPGKQYNPLFIWGGVGLGKTHLLHAIGNRIREVHPEISTLYVQTKTFINDFIDSIRFSTPQTFRNKYSNVGCLLIDDIQFLVGKPSCQEEFFYTFNAIYDSKKQIVLTSDKPPKDIEGLEERLISRFVWGLVVPIDPPDLETRIAILRSKADEERVYVPEDVIVYLASEIQNNIRVLEGALTKVVANAALLGTPLTVDTAKKILQDIIVKDRETKPITIEKIQRAVAEHYNIKFSDMKSRKRTEALALPRQIAMYLARELTNEPYAVIGEDFGGKDHSTIIYAINKIKSMVTSDPFFSAEINKIIKKINYD